MKLAISSLLAGLFLAASATATPDHSVEVRERFFGSNKTDYAILRTEDDNQCSHYVSRVATWLDEYSKDDARRENPHRTLLLDVTYHRDPDTPAQVTEEPNSKDATLDLASLLQRYPTRALTPWTPEGMAKMFTNPKAGIHFRNRELIGSAEFISQVLFGGSEPDATWRLDSVSGDMDSIYLQLSAGQDENQQTRLLCVPPAISKRINDQLAMQPLYLVAGTFATKDAAIARTKELRRLAREKKLYGFHPEVWSSLPASDKTTYLVVDGYSTETIASGRIPTIESELGIDYLPMPSERFIERIPSGRE